jgi:sec-independent protein translocase protein TatB
MLDVGWSEMLVIAVVLIVVVGPKDLPHVLRAIGKVVRKARGMADEFRRGVDDFIRESELKDLKDGVNQVKDFNLNRLRSETERQFNQSMNQTIDLDAGPGPKAGPGAGKHLANGAGATGEAVPPPKTEPAKAAATGTDNKDA